MDCDSKVGRVVRVVLALGTEQELGAVGGKIIRVRLVSLRTFTLQNREAGEACWLNRMLLYGVVSSVMKS